MNERFKQLAELGKEMFKKYPYTEYGNELRIDDEVAFLFGYVSQIKGLTNEMVDYLNVFVETFDENLYSTTTNIMSKWIEDGVFDEIINQTVLKDLNDELNEYYQTTMSALNNKRNKEDKIVRSDLSIANDNDKIGLINLAEEVQAAMSGSAPVLPNLADKSVTGLKYADNSISNNALSDGFVYVKQLGAEDDTNFVYRSGAYLIIGKPINAPEQLPASSIMTVSQLNSRWVNQRIVGVTFPHEVFEKVLDKQNPQFSKWVKQTNYPSDKFLTSTDDANNYTKQNHFIAINPINAPAEGTYNLEIKNFYTSHTSGLLWGIQTWTNINGLGLKYERGFSVHPTNGVKWYNYYKLGDITNDKYLVETDDANDYTKNDSFIAINPLNAPQEGTYAVEIKRFYTSYTTGLYWGVQTWTDINGLKLKYERTFYFHPNSGLKWHDYYRLSNSSSSGTGNSYNLDGKIIVNFGDSIFGNTRGATSVSNFIAERTGATVINVGFGGSRIAKHQPYWDAFSWYRLVDELVKPNTDTTKWVLQDQAINASKEGLVNGMPQYFEQHLNALKNIDMNNVFLITISGGTNDYTAGVKIENTENPLDTETFKGSLRYGLDKITTKYKQLNVVIGSPIYRFWRDDNGVFIDDSDTRLYAEQSLTDFVRACEEVSLEYKVKFLNNYDKLGINFQNKEHYFPSNDGTHPNTNGNELLGRAYGSFIASNY